MKKKRLLSLLAAVALVCGLVGCQADTDTGQVDTEQTVQETQQTTEATAEQTEHIKDISETLGVDTALKVQVTKDNSNIIVDEEKRELYYFFKDNEIVDLSTVEIPAYITELYICPLKKDYHFRELKGLNSEQADNGVLRMYITGGEIKDVSFLNNANNLIGVVFISCTIENDFSLSDYENIQYVNLTSCKIDNLSFLDEMPQLEILRLDDMPINDISPIFKIKNLDYLYLTNCQTINVPNETNLLNTWDSLLEVDFSNSIISDFSFLTGIPIHELKLSGTYGSNYDTMKGLDIGVLWLNGNNLTDISFLVQNKIGTLLLEENNISDWSPLLEVESLVWCWTFDNPVIMPDNKEEFEKKGITLADSNQWAYPY